MGYGTALGLSGRLREAGDCFDDALEAAALTGSDELRVMALTHRCWITLWQGDVIEALRIGQDAVACTDGVKGWFSAVAYGMLAQARFYADHPAGRVDLLLRAGQGPQLRQLDSVYRLGWVELLVEAAAALFDEAGDGVDAGCAYLLAAATLETSRCGEQARRQLARPARCLTPAAPACSKPAHCARSGVSTLGRHANRVTSTASPVARRRSRHWCRRA